MTTETWAIDASHSGIHFSVRHLVIAKVRGQFSRWSGTVNVPGGDFAKASVAVTIDASSIETGVADRDGHLKSTDFFKDSNSKMVGTVSKVEKAGSDYKVTVDLAFNGATHPVVFDAEFLGIVPGMNGRHFGATLRGTLDRTQWGVNWNMPAGEGLLVSNEIKLELEIAADEGK